MDWEIIQLGDLCEFKNGLWKGKNPPYVSSKVIRMTNFTKECEMNNIMPVELEVEERQFSSRSLIDGDLILEKSGGGPKQPVGRVVRFIASNNDNYSFSNFTTRMRVTNLRKVDSKYLHKFLKFFYLMGKTIPLQSNSTGIRNLQLPAFREILIPVPSLEIQKQIVVKIDQAFAAIDTAKLNIEKNLENAKELFQSKLNEIFSQKGDDWVESKLEEITIKIGSGATPRGGQSSYKESGISLIRSLNIFDDGFRKGKLAFIDETQAEKLNNVTIEIGDVLLNITGASVARCCIAPSECLPARVNQHVSIIRLKEDTMSSEFLHYLLIAKLNKDLLLGIGDQGATRQAITKKQIESFIISYPEGDKEQKQSIRLINNLKNQILSLESKYQQELNSLQELKKSILEKAFAGEL